MRASLNIPFLVALASVTVAGCATNPDKMTASYVSPMRYSSYDCDQIAMEKYTLERRISELHGVLKKESSNDNAQMAVGMLLFWPTLFFLEGGDGPQATEYQRLKGEYEALGEASVMKKCGSGVQSITAAVSNDAAGAPSAPQLPEESQYWNDATLLESVGGMASAEVLGSTGGTARIEVPQTDLRAGFISAELVGFQFKEERTRVSPGTISVSLPAEHYWIALRGRKIEPDTVKLTLEEGQCYELAYRIDNSGEWIPVLYATRSMD